MTKSKLSKERMRNLADIAEGMPSDHEMRNEILKGYKEILSHDEFNTLLKLLREPKNSLDRIVSEGLSSYGLHEDLCVKENV